MLYTQHTAQVCMNVPSFPVGLPALPRHVVFITLLVHICRKEMGVPPPQKASPVFSFSPASKKYENIAA